jgi:hydrogenase-4 component F
MLHAVNHSLTKAGLFFIAGNILNHYRTKAVKEVRGVLTVLPRSGVLWMAGFFAITGTPPFGVFLSKFVILRAAFDQGRAGLAVLFLAVLCAIFIGAARIFLPMAQGTAPEDLKQPEGKEPEFSVYPTMVLLALVLVLGMYIPEGLSDLLNAAARMVTDVP